MAKYRYYCKKCGWERSQLMDKSDYSVWCPRCRDGQCEVEDLLNGLVEYPDWRKIFKVVGY
jgi:Zn finger protein HypA/HybF involved in hydrogenase expression